ncbi:MAG: hypothetical protein ABJB74_10445, partial [Gemmatimonas sp.]
PIYGWLLFLSSWAGRAAVAWAFGPFVALWVAAASAGTGASNFFEERMKELVGGWLDDAIVWPRNVGSTSFVEPAVVNLLRTPHLWIGIVFAAVCIAGAVYVRKHREPR